MQASSLNEVHHVSFKATILSQYWYVLGTLTDNILHFLSSDSHYYTWVQAPYHQIEALSLDAIILLAVLYLMLAKYKVQFVQKLLVL